MEKSNPNDLLGAFVGASEMEELTRTFEWSKTPVGPMNKWPQSLATMIKTILANRYPMWLAWGQNLTLFYNDAYAKMTLGPKHPWALGRSLCEVWPEVGSRAESVLYSGQATRDERLLFFLKRNGFLEETYHTFSYSPVFDDQGHINGILCVVIEETERNISARRLYTLRELAAHHNKEVKSVEDACKTSIRILEKNPKDVPFALLYLLDGAQKLISLAASSGIMAGEPLSPVSLELSDSEEPWPFTSVIKSGCSIIISHPPGQFGPLPGGPWPEPSPQAIVLPLAKPGQNQFMGFLVVGVSARRSLDDAYRGFFDLVAGQVAISITKAQACEGMHESEEHFRTLISATSDVVYRMNADWSEIRYLQGREFITDLLEPCKKWIDKYIHQEDQVHVKQTMQEAIQARGLFDLEHRGFRLDGSLGWTHSRAIPILNKKEEIIEWFGIASDVSIRKEAEQALLNTSRHKDEFLATVAHELRTPLVPIFNALEIMRLAKKNAPIIEQAQDIIERQVVQMARLIEDLLDLNRISHGKIQLHMERIELSKVIQQTLESSYPIIKAAEHKLHVDLPSYPIYIQADITRLTQVFSNLLNNASKYTEKGGMIWLSAQLHHDHVVVSVLDNGIGIPAHMLLHIFDKFTQVDKQLERSKEGLGIGLWLAKQLVELHGGTVEAKSKGENFGSEFIVRIPIASSLDYKNEPINPTHCRRILVVDDNVDITTSLTLLLELMGYTIKIASNGLDAIDTASSFRPDLILMDIGMPQLNGYDVAKEIRKQPWGKNIILAALTGRGLEHDRRRAKEAGFDFHITKPIKPDMLEKLLTDIEFNTV